MLFIAAPRKYFRRLSRRKSSKVHRLGKILYVFSRMQAKRRKQTAARRSSAVMRPVWACGAVRVRRRRRAGRRAARPLRPVGGNARLARTRPFKPFFLRKRKYTLPPIGGRVYFVYRVQKRCHQILAAELKTA